MRILLVTEQYPWPAVTGAGLRVHHVVQGLLEVGEVDVLALCGSELPDVDDPAIPGVTVFTVPAPQDEGVLTWLGKWITSGTPRRLLKTNWSNVVEQVNRIEGFDGSAYDLVWFSHVDSWFAMADHLDVRRSIVDMYDLENLALRLRRKVPPRSLPGASIGARARELIRWVVSRAFDLVDERRWDRLQRRSGRVVDRVVVCSDEDARRSGCRNVVVVPNGADGPKEVDTDRRGLRGNAPTMLFVGALDYEPNTDAVEWFVREIFGQVRERVPDATVRVVGRGSSMLSWMEQVDGVELIGMVQDLEPELKRADVAIVPIRVGAGTRLKVVEALANHIPMVTTSIGCEGIDLVDGEHALIADDAGTFASGCARLLADGELRQVLADNGAGLFAKSYDWQMIEEQLAELVTTTMGGNA